MVTIRDIKTICTAPEGINLLVVKVETSEPGLYGLGCGTFAYRHLAVKLVVEEYLRPLLIGRDVSDINDIWQLMHQNGYWRNGPIENNAISGVDMALWDIKGKMANMPLYQLFGGKCREGVPVYRHVDGRDLSEICENIAKYREIGVKTIRCQCGGYGGSEYGHTPAGAPVGAKPGVYLDGNAYIRDTVKLFDGIRSKMGDEIGLVHDVHERIAPGYMDTEMNVALTDPKNPKFTQQRYDELTQRIPAHRWGTPDDMKGCCIFLASHASDYLGGAIIPVDGGYLVM